MKLPAESVCDAEDEKNSTPPISAVGSSFRWLLKPQFPSRPSPRPRSLTSKNEAKLS